MQDYEREQLIRELAHIGLQKISNMNRTRRWRLETALEKLKGREKLASEAEDILGEPPAQVDRLIEVG